MNTTVLVCLIIVLFLVFICAISSVYCAYELHCIRRGIPVKKPKSESRYV